MTRDRADRALVFQDKALASSSATHVFIVGVGRYDFGRGKRRNMVAGDLGQLSSPPVTARAVADWFLSEFKSPARPLGSLAMCISEETATEYVSPDGKVRITPPDANLATVEKAASRWCKRLNRAPDNTAVFYFCGHGVSLGQKAALLLSDFGAPANAYKGAIDFDTLRGTMKNAAANRQLFLLDCCRTKADSLYQNEPSIGTRIFSIPVGANGVQSGPVRQCILFPTIDGETAFGQKDRPSVFATSFLDAVKFAAPDDQTGRWVATTSLILNAVDRLIEYRLPEQMRKRTVPNALEATNFEFNEITPPNGTRSYITLADPNVWTAAELACVEAGQVGPSVAQRARASEEIACCVFDLTHGTWEFSGRLDAEPPRVAPVRRTLTRPVAYVRLEVVP